MLPCDLIETLKSRNLHWTTAQENLAAIEAADEATISAWPAFMLNDTIANQYWQHLIPQVPQYHFALQDLATGQWVALGASIPFYWDKPLEQLPDAGWDWVLQTGIDQIRSGIRPNYLSALAIQIQTDYQGRGLSSIMIRIMSALAQQAGLKQLVAPVRPNQKHHYPLIHMQDYIQWKSEDLPFDAWLRTHVRLGARILKVCPQAMEIKGSIEKWTEWTGMQFLSSGKYIIPGALVPVEIDIETATGKYVEPNVWCVHTP